MVFVSLFFGHYFSSFWWCLNAGFVSIWIFIFVLFYNLTGLVFVQ